MSSKTMTKRRSGDRLMRGAAALALGGAVLAAAPAQAVTTVLTFDNAAGPLCGSGPIPTGGPASRACQFNGDFIGNNYGSSAELQVSYDISNASFDRLAFLLYNGFPNQVGTTDAFSGMTAQNTSFITFTPTAGQEVSFLSFGAASPPTNRGRFTVSAGGTMIYDTTAPLMQTLSTFTVNSAYSSGPLVFSFVGDTNSNTLRLDDITFDVRPIAVTPPSSAVPEPATWAMMLLGFGSMGYVMRRPKANMRVRFA